MVGFSLCHLEALGQPLQEVRRGSERAEIYSICFDMKSQRLACSSDHGTIHVFQVQLDTTGGMKLSNEEKDGGAEAPQL